MRILGLDFETIGTPKEEPFLPSEIGLAILDTDTFRILEARSVLINAGHPVKEKFLNFTHLTQDQINEGIQIAEMCCIVEDLMSRADAVMVWNGYFFDRTLLKTLMAQYAVEMPELPWIDLKIDGGFRHHLGHEAADKGFLIQGAHTALADVFGMFEILKRSNLDIDQMYIAAHSEFVEIFTSAYEYKDAAAQEGFRWDAGVKKWIKAVRLNELQEVDNKKMFKSIPVEIL